MAWRVLRRLLVLPVLVLALSCSVATDSQRLGRLADAVRNPPQVLPPADSAAPAPVQVEADPIAKADVLVFAARPGDAVVAAYATISQAVAQGKRVAIVYVTNGDAQTAVAQALAALPVNATPTPRHYLHGAAVLQEVAVRVSEQYFALASDQVIFLSYPDGVLHELAPDAPDRIVRSPYTERDGVHDPNVTPYRILRSGHGYPYAFVFVLRDLNDVLVELNPQEIYFPSPASADETVAAAGGLIARSLREVAPRHARLLMYVQGVDTRQPPDLRVPVSAAADKQRALAMYAARIGMAGWPVMPAALLEEEVFWQFDFAGDE